ncbi:hypothetical protein [Sphingobacterium faecium]|uniref:hypothetical protein n=1 Tax=Sphingobacterium faecium TaxID=34087 RepID=UPI002479B617|nr:hypothetical protein [Sphingobacterium faecium]WGQ15618.1 hypothetical protein QG727_04230 [Sphingobacterium faecium]
MRNKQIQNLALVLADLSDISHVNSTMSFINMSGRNYVNVAVGNNVFTIDGETVKIFAPPTEVSFACFLKGLMSIADDSISDYGS